MEILHLYISPEHTFVGHHGQEPGEAPMTGVPRIECVAGHGIRGDRYFDHKPDYKGQITFFAFETFEWLCERLGVYGKELSVFRRNVITRGVDLNSLIGGEFDVQGVRLFGTEEARPCYWMDRAFGEGAREALEGRGGLRARILSDGIIRGSAAPREAGR